MLVVIGESQLRCPKSELYSITESIILEDLERVFEDGGEDSKLTNSVLKLCLSQPPCKDCHSQMSAWLMAGRLAAIELHYVSHSDSQVL